MINNLTIDKLIDMQLTAMAEAFLQQLSNPKMKDAEFEQPDASIIGINYTSGRKIKKDLIRRLSTCEYIAEFRNVFITSATDCGKTYFANAFSMEACKHYFKIR